MGTQTALAAVTIAITAFAHQNCALTVDGRRLCVVALEKGYWKYDVPEISRAAPRPAVDPEEPASLGGGAGWDEDDDDILEEAVGSALVCGINPVLVWWRQGLVERQTAAARFSNGGLSSPTAALDLIARRSRRLSVFLALIPHPPATVLIRMQQPRCR
ncbi:hypothetical protein BDK51DRAFT_44011 [Blyttiomyces helicus]|uniref:Uncharacterized protein n=1 Tax=Blyttiomyces helicus TaxID=388810 RepID=A0A4P9W5P7_9FUNG|nr:hypothetical protein BDK51DRAFT_44011 [Blyttiomyces helicus]|eukprot:RKO86238.1 hypothetical protein BDK51DRAFT_44011 [Blyttiomyces helicus]